MQSSKISPSPQTLPDWNPVAGGIQAFYFQDPDGHNLELIHFPAAKGDRKWQRPTDELFLGIDHTAIVVANTAASSLSGKPKIALVGCVSDSVTHPITAKGVLASA